MQQYFAKGSSANDLKSLQGWSCSVHIRKCMEVSIVDDMRVSCCHGMSHLPGVQDADIAGSHCH